MTLAILGVGVVTPLGCDVAEVSRRIAAGERAERVEGFDILQFTASERLRRAPPVSLFAVAAAARAVESAGPEARAIDGSRVAVIAAVSKGAMIYSTRFHEQFAKGGGRAVVPLLFPETVANAPASHVASVLGLSGPNTTLLGDSAVAYNALAVARDVLAWGLADAALVVAPHEHAAIMADGYRRFRWVFRDVRFSEGAAALLVAPEGARAGARDAARFGEILHVDRGFPYRSRRDIPPALASALRAVPWIPAISNPTTANPATMSPAVAGPTASSPAIAGPTTMSPAIAGPTTSSPAIASPTIVSVSGAEALPYPGARRVAIKESLGEAFAAAALWQIVFGLDSAAAGETVLSTCIGLNEQVSVVLARR